MKTLEIEADETTIPNIENLKTTSIKRPGREKDDKKQQPYGVVDLPEYACDAECDNCHCATY